MKYSDSGVNITRGDEFVTRIRETVESTYTEGVIEDFGGFAGLFDLSRLATPGSVLVAATDGVGTKLAVAAAMQEYSTIGIDLVAMCVNDVVTKGAKPLFFLDYIASGKLDVSGLLPLVEGMAKGCKQAGCALIGGETAEMPGFYSGNSCDIAGFCVGGASRAELLPKKGSIKKGDLLLGIRSSGFHANGFSLVRKVMELNNIDYTSDSGLETGRSWGSIMLEPTRIYVDHCLAVVGLVKAFAHITGGGLPGNIARILPQGMSADFTYSVWPELFRWVAEVGKIDEDEMMRTFNCGIGMVMVVDPSDEAAVRDHIDEDLLMVGYVT